MLLGQTGLEKNGWRNAPFYWPVFVVQRNVHEGIFTINANKKKRVPKKQFKLETINKYPEDEVLYLASDRNTLFDILYGATRELTKDIKRTTASLYLEKDIFGNYIRVEGTDPDKYYDLSTYNDGIFPFEIKKYKYIYLRCSMDFSGSQAIVKLKEESYKLLPERYIQEDNVYTDQNEAVEATDESLCTWSITYLLDKVLEVKLTEEDRILYEWYIQEKEGDAASK